MEKNNRWRRLFGQSDYNPSDRSFIPSSTYSGIFSGSDLLSTIDLSGNDVVDSFLYGVPIDK